MPGLRLRLGLRYASSMMRQHVLHIGMATISLAAACSTGGGHADFDLKKVPGSTVFESEKDYASTIVGTLPIIQQCLEQRRDHRALPTEDIRQ